VWRAIWISAKAKHQYMQQQLSQQESPQQPGGMQYFSRILYRNLMAMAIMCKNKARPQE